MTDRIINAKNLVVPFLLVCCSVLAEPSGHLEKTPQIPENPRFVHTNDGNADVHTLELIMALASAGRIRLEAIVADLARPSHAADGMETQGMEVCKAYASDQFGTRNEVWEAGRHWYQQIVEMGRRAGFDGLPDALAGPCWTLTRPKNGKIEATEPLGSPGAEEIWRMVIRSTEHDPLFIVPGGTFTAIADAYLLGLRDSRFSAERVDELFQHVVVIAAPGNEDASEVGGYNTIMDGWAAHIVALKMRLVHISYLRQDPYIKKSWLIPGAANPIFDPSRNEHNKCNQKPGPVVKRPKASDVPQSEILRFMAAKDQGGVRLPCDRDGDSLGVVALVEAKILGELERAAVSGDVKRQLPDYLGGRAVNVPRLKRETTGGVWVSEIPGVEVRKFRELSTQVWWEGMAAREAYHRDPIQQAPYRSRPVTVPATIQAEEFDWGGLGYGFFSNNYIGWPFFRVDLSKRNACLDPKNRGIYLTDIAVGDWWEYSITVPKPGTYSVEATVSDTYKDGTVVVRAGEFDNQVVNPDPAADAGSVCQDGGRVVSWRRVSLGSIQLDKGPTTVRMESKGEGFDIDALFITEAR